MDIILLFTCLALLLIDLQIKNDIVKQAKELEEVLSGQSRAPEHDDIPDLLRSDILRSDDSDQPAMATEYHFEAPVKGTRPRKGSTAAAKRNTRNNGTGIQSDGEQVGA
jgi:hypothetical protein